MNFTTPRESTVVQPMHDTSTQYTDSQTLNRLAKRYGRTAKAIAGTGNDGYVAHYTEIVSALKAAEAALLNLRKAINEGKV